eukprot:249604-Amphidinium_carterae.2
MFGPIEPLPWQITTDKDGSCGLNSRHKHVKSKSLHSLRCLRSNVLGNPTQHTHTHHTHSDMCKERLISQAKKNGSILPSLATMSLRS